MTRLTIGSRAPTIDRIDLSGGRFRLGGGRRPALLVFLRHLMWIPWRDHLLQLQRRRSIWEKGRAELVAVSFEPPERLRLRAAEFPEIRFLSDPERDLYRRYGIDRGGWHRVLGVATLAYYARALFRGRFSGSRRRGGGQTGPDPDRAGGRKAARGAGRNPGRTGDRESGGTSRPTDYRQLGADFLVAADRRLAFVHYSENPADRPTAATIEAELGRLEAPDPGMR